MMRGRRRQHLLAVSTLTAVGGFLRAGLAQLPVQRPLSGRRLMHAALQVRACAPPQGRVSAKLFPFKGQFSFFFFG